MSELLTMRRRLIEAWLAIPDHPPADQVDALCDRSCGLVRLIGWIDTHQTATVAEYRAERDRVRGDPGGR